MQMQGAINAMASQKKSVATHALRENADGSEDERSTVQEGEGRALEEPITLPFAAAIPSGTDVSVYTLAGPATTWSEGFVTPRRLVVDHTHNVLYADHALLSVFRKKIEQGLRSPPLGQLESTLAPDYRLRNTRSFRVAECLVFAPADEDNATTILYPLPATAGIYR
jgi:hypothetical protein